MTQAEFAGKLGIRSSIFLHHRERPEGRQSERAARMARSWAMRSLSLYGLLLQDELHRAAFDTP